jgi:uncharacterized caspase-like protein
MDVVVWLRSLGLEQYEATFRDNAIDDSARKATAAVSVILRGCSR